MRNVFLLGLLLCASAQARERVVTLSPHLTELVCAAGGCAQLVGVGAYSDYPAQVKKLPVVGDAASLNAEALLALRTSLILAWDGGTPASQMALLDRLGLKLRSVRIETLPQVADALEEIGGWLSTERIASAVAADYRSRLAALATRYADAKPVRVFYQIETRPAFTVNAQSPISQAIKLCGGVNVFADLPALAAPVSDEAVLAAKPDVVIHGERDAEAMLAYWSRFPDAPPVAQGHIYGVDADLLTRSGPRLIEGAELLCVMIERARQ